VQVAVEPPPQEPALQVVL
jgi:hypothetical protein